jgi:hypothetical protein
VIRVTLETVPRRWFADDHVCIVAAPGPSLTPGVAEQCRGHDVIVVQDAYRLMPWAPILYGCDVKWWRYHRGALDFAGEKWTIEGPGYGNDKRGLAASYGLRVVAGAYGDTFSVDPARINTGRNSGFQAVGLAIHFGARRIVLVGFDMRECDGRNHFFGNHPHPLHNTKNYKRFVAAFASAAKSLPPGVSILNATPDSALTCFPFVNLADVVQRRIDVAA